ncbi:putative nucleotide-diphospho-sugar transferase [Methylocystis echinoides]|uniref:putative nucleotide-diphospho-sugar transferase n=1 Tax=Methylocystis echinoides TaxID=29468 RepID=UPI00343CD596
MDIVKTDSILPDTTLITVCTAGYLPFILNLHASLEQIGLGGELVVYTPDPSVQQMLSARGIRAEVFGRNSYNKWTNFGESGWCETMAYKYAVAAEILKTGKKVFFVDGDIVFLRNPGEHLKLILETTTAPLIMQFESPKGVYCAGFWLARPDPVVLELFRDIQSHLVEIKTDFSDQECLNRLGRERDIKVHALDVELFACANQFLGRDMLDTPERIDRPSTPFPFDSAYVLHFNYLIGKKQKIQAMAKYNAIYYQGLLEAAEEKLFSWNNLSDRAHRLRRRLSRRFGLEWLKKTLLYSWPDTR